MSDRQNVPDLPADVDWSAFAIVAVDLDGTAAGPDGRVSPEGLRALQAAEQSGLHPVIVTGRALPAAMGVWLRAGLSRPVIACGGALVTWPTAGRALRERPLDPAVVDRALQCARDLDLIPFLYGASSIVTDRRSTWRDRLAHLNEIPIAVHPAAERDAGAGLPPGGPAAAPAPVPAPETAPASAPADPPAGDPPVPAVPAEAGAGPGGLAAWHRGHVYKVVLATDPERAGAVRPAVEEGLRGLEACCVATLPGLLEIVRPDATKEAALEDLCRMLGVPRQRVMAIGDGENDLGMIRWAGFGVAMANARPEVRAAARLVIGHHAEEGVARFLQAVVARRAERRGEGG
ncbi:HAD family hydrolase [Thermaerobacter marianensis]|nr:HAD family hydrolase [Thermaerobacter marianensis]